MDSLAVLGGVLPRPFFDRTPSTPCRRSIVQVTLHQDTTRKALGSSPFNGLISAYNRGILPRQLNHFYTSR